MGPGRGEDGVELRRGAALALERANARLAAQGGRESGTPVRTFDLVSLSDDGPWGVAAKKVVELAYRHRVLAIVGGLDGHHLHLAELVAAKAWVPVVSPWATDRSVDFANVPWVFRMPPDDQAMAEALLRAAVGLGSAPLVVREEHRVGRVGEDRLRAASARLGIPLAGVMVFDPVSPDPGQARGHEGPVVLWARGGPGRALLARLRAAGFRGPVLVPGTMACGIEDPGVVVAATFDWASPGPGYRRFLELYHSRYGQDPCPLAAHSFDAVTLVARAVERAGPNRARIRDRIAASDMLGATGRIGFGPLGGGLGRPVLVRREAGRWVHLTPGPRASTGGR